MIYKNVLDESMVKRCMYEASLVCEMCVFVKLHIFILSVLSLLLPLLSICFCRHHLHHLSIACMYSWTGFNRQQYQYQPVLATITVYKLKEKLIFLHVKLNSKDICDHKMFYSLF